MRLDKYIQENFLEYTRSKAADIIKRGFVYVDGKVVTKPGYELKGHEQIEIKYDGFASRAGEKLDYAIRLFDVDVKDYVAVDIGASTGGFTDCLLKAGVHEVYAYDVGKNQMIERLKNDPRVHSFEETNILDVKIPKNDICVIDVSFTSIIPILNHIKDDTNLILFLFKPQFETQGRGLKKGILKDIKIQQQAIQNITMFIQSINYRILGFTKSPIEGKDGNEEFLFLIQKGWFNA